MRDVLPVDDLESLADKDVGEALRLTREHYKQSLSDVEKVLRIRSSQIDAIERGDMTLLPGRVYAIGFVRSYAEYLDVDANKVVQLFKAQYMDGKDKSDLSFPVPASETKTPSLMLVLASVVAVLFLFVWWQQYAQRDDRGDVMVLERVPDDIKEHVDLAILSVADSDPLPLVVDPVVVEAAGDSVVENMGDSAAQSKGIILNIIGNSWVEIKNGAGKVLVSSILEKDDQYFVPDSPGLSMSLGNAANVEILVEGRLLKPLGKDGDVRKGIPLNIAYLNTLSFVEVESDPLPDEAFDGAVDVPVSE